MFSIDLEAWANKACLAWLTLSSGDVLWGIKITNRWMSLKQVSDMSRGLSDILLDVCVIAEYDFQVLKNRFSFLSYKTKMLYHNLWMCGKMSVPYSCQARGWHGHHGLVTVTHNSCIWRNWRRILQSLQRLYLWFLWGLECGPWPQGCLHVGAIWCQLLRGYKEPCHPFQAAHCLECQYHEYWLRFLFGLQCHGEFCQALKQLCLVLIIS